VCQHGGYFSTRRATFRRHTVQHLALPSCEYISKQEAKVIWRWPPRMTSPSPNLWISKRLFIAMLLGFPRAFNPNKTSIPFSRFCMQSCATHPAPQQPMADVQLVAKQKSATNLQSVIGLVSVAGTYCSWQRPSRYRGLRAR